MATPCLFSKKNSLITPTDQNPLQTVTRFRCVDFSVPQILFTYPPVSRWASPEKMIFFFVKIGIFGKSFAGRLSKANTYWFQLLNQLDFVWHHTKVFVQNSCQWCIRSVQLLRTTVNWCWWRFTHTFCHSSNIVGCTHCFRLFTLWFLDEDAGFFHFFPKIRKKFLHTFCNNMLQYFPALFKHIYNHTCSAQEQN